jgi:FkbM family methyltransferase
VNTESSYSQSGEDVIICRELAARRPGTFLDIGAFHPFKFSNTRRLYELGYKGVFVEPSPSLRAPFDQAYGSDPDILFLPLCIGEQCGVATLYDANGDATSSTIPEETKKWTDAYGTRFTPLQIEMVDVPELLRRCPYPAFDFVNIDTEGNVWQIVKQFDFRALDTQVVCLEWNGREEDLYLRHLRDQGFREVYRNAENMIFSRQGS